MKTLCTVLIAILLPSFALAADLRVQDQQGLVRAVRALHTDKASVEIKTSESGSGEMTLTPQNGLGLSRQSKRSGGQSFSFPNVQAGSWQIEGKFQVLEVKVKE